MPMPTLQPARRALLRDAEARHRGGDQQRDADRVERHRELQQPLRRHLRDDEQHARAPAACCGRGRRSACRGRSRPSTSITSPAAASSSTARPSGTSKPVKTGRSRCRQRGLVEDGDSSPALPGARCGGLCRLTGCAADAATATAAGAEADGSGGSPGNATGGSRRPRRLSSRPAAAPTAAGRGVPIGAVDWPSRVAAMSSSLGYWPAARSRTRGARSAPRRRRRSRRSRRPSPARSAASSSGANAM